MQLSHSLCQRKCEKEASLASDPCWKLHEEAHTKWYSTPEDRSPRESLSSQGHWCAGGPLSQSNSIRLSTPAGEHSTTSSTRMWTATEMKDVGQYNSNRHFCWWSTKIRCLTKRKWSDRTNMMYHNNLNPYWRNLNLECPSGINLILECPSGINLILECPSGINLSSNAMWMKMCCKS